jgi:hypothetical protein
MDQLEREDETEEKKQYAEMQDGEIVPVYEYHYTGTVNVWTENGIEQR